MADSLHADKGAIIRHIVKCRMYVDPPLLKFFFYIPRKLDIGTIDTINLLQHGIKFIDFWIHLHTAFPLLYPVQLYSAHAQDIPCSIRNREKGSSSVRLFTHKTIVAPSYSRCMK